MFIIDDFLLGAVLPAIASGLGTAVGGLGGIASSLAGAVPGLSSLIGSSALARLGIGSVAEPAAAIAESGLSAFSPAMYTAGAEAVGLPGGGVVAPLIEKTTASAVPDLSKLFGTVGRYGLLGGLLLPRRPSPPLLPDTRGGIATAGPSQGNPAYDFALTSLLLSDILRGVR